MKLGSIKILRDLVVVEPLTQKKKNVGFTMPDEITDYVGKVVGLGPGTGNISMGDTIYFGNEKKEMSIKGQNVIVMEQDNVVGIEENKEETNQE